MKITYELVNTYIEQDRHWRFDIINPNFIFDHFNGMAIGVSFSEIVHLSNNSNFTKFMLDVINKGDSVNIEFFKKYCLNDIPLDISDEKLLALKLL